MVVYDPLVCESRHLPPIDLSGNFCPYVCNAIIKHIPQLPKSRSFDSGGYVKYPPKCNIAGGEGWLPKVLFAIHLISFLTLGLHAKFQNQKDNFFLFFPQQTFPPKSDTRFQDPRFLYFCLPKNLSIYCCTNLGS